MKIWHSFVMFWNLSITLIIISVCRCYKVKFVISLIFFFIKNVVAHEKITIHPRDQDIAHCLVS